MRDFPTRERRLLLALLALAVLLNVPYGRFALYPLMLFSTWVHEFFHGIASVAVGGSVEGLSLYPDGSGLTMSRRPEGRLITAFVASAGYTGTALLGAAMLMVRRLRGVGRFGTAALGAVMLLSALLWVRNVFGLAVTVPMGLLLLAAGLRLSEAAAGFLFAFLASATCLNALTSIRTLFSANLIVNGQVVERSDAVTVAQALLLPSWLWASLWLLLAVVATLGGLVLAFGGRDDP